jgi:hypothetical protein
MKMHIFTFFLHLEFLYILSLTDINKSCNECRKPFLSMEYLSNIALYRDQSKDLSIIRFHSHDMHVMYSH